MTYEPTSLILLFLAIYPSQILHVAAKTAVNILPKLKVNQKKRNFLNFVLARRSMMMMLSRCMYLLPVLENTKHNLKEFKENNLKGPMHRPKGSKGSKENIEDISYIPFQFK